MKKLLQFWPFFLFCVIFVGIFYKVFFLGLLPFPGDLLVSWFFPYSSGGWEGYSPWITHKEFIAADIVRQLYPWRTLAIEILNDGIIPLWNLYSFAGTPLLANVQSAVFYPFNILFFILHPVIAWNVYILLQPVLAFMFMFLFIRSLHLSKQSGVLCGLAFGFMGYMNIWFEWGVVGHSALWLPLILWGITKYTEKENHLYLLVAPLSIACSVFAGHGQTSVYVVIVSFAYYFFVMSQKYSIKKFFLNTWIFLLAIGITAIQILPSIELLSFSARNSAESIVVFQRFQLPLQHLIMFLAPDFFGNPATLNFWGKDYGEFMGYIGIVALLFAIIGIFHAWKNKIVRFFILTVIVALLFALPTFLSELLVLLHVPVLSTGIPARSLYIVEFCFIVLAGFGFDAFLSKKTFKPYPIIFLGVLYGLLWVFVLVTPVIFPQITFAKFLFVAKRNLILPTGIFFTTALLIYIGTKKQALKPILLIGCIFIAAFEYQYFLYKFSPFAPAHFIFPSHPVVTYLQKITPPDRVYGYDTARIETNIATQWHILSPEGYDPLYIKRYGELMHASQKGKLDRNIQRSDALFTDSLPKEDTYSKQVLMNLLGVKYVVDKDDNPQKEWEPEYNKFPEDRYKLIWQKEKWKVYENKQAFPRAAVFYNTKVINKDELIMGTLFNDNFPYQSTLIIEEKPVDFMLSEKTTIKPAIIKTYQSNNISIDVNTPKNGMLFLSDNYYPGWKAYVDGKETKIYRADYTFRAVPVLAGKHIVTFIYKPMSFIIGAGISSISILIFLILSIIFFKHGKIYKK